MKNTQVNLKPRKSWSTTLILACVLSLNPPSNPYPEIIWWQSCFLLKFFFFLQKNFWLHFSWNSLWYIPPEFKLLQLVVVVLFFLIFTFWPCHVPHGILVSQSGMNPCPMQWNHRVLTTGPPEEALLFF